MEQTYFENLKSVLNNNGIIDCKKENISITLSDIQKREMFEIERVLYNYAGVHFVGKHGENIYLILSDMSVLYNYNGVHFVGKHGENIYLILSDMSVLYNYNGVHFVGKHGENIYLSFSGISVFDICNIVDALRLVCNKK